MDGNHTDKANTFLSVYFYAEKIKETKCLNARTQLRNNNSTSLCQFKASWSVLIEKLNALFSQEVRRKNDRYVYFKDM